MIAASRLGSAIRRFLAETRAAALPIFGVAVPAFAIVAAVALQYGFLVQQKTALQNAADQAALGAAKSLTLASADAATIPQVATAIARASLGTNTYRQTDAVAAEAVDGNTGVAVTVTRTVLPIFGGILGSSAMNVTARAVAHATSSMPVCIIGLDAKRKGTLSLQNNAVVQALGCAAYSNSDHPWSISSVDNAVLSTGLTCAVGGKQGNFPNFMPQPKSGCPSVPDPLGARPPPAIGPCDHTNYVATGLVETLSPGVYCGGITISGVHAVTLLPGTYILTNGPLLVEKGGVLAGANVGIFLSGQGAVINFQPLSTITLTAPITGALAGLLFFEDRASPGEQLHQVLSMNAQVLLGTIYLPVGRFYVGANGPVAGKSAYTIVVADTVELSAGPTLVLNTNYTSTNIPVPAGLGPIGGKTHLDH